MVSTPELAIARAALAATLSRADPSSLTRGAVAEFLQLLDSTLDECSRPNVQKCKNWILANVVASTARAATLGRYLVALSESMELDYDRPSVKRRRLHALYLVSDVLHHVARQGNRDFARAWDAHLPAMVATTSTFEKCPKHLSKVRNLINLWEQRDYLSANVIARLRDSFSRASDKESGTRIHMTSEALKLAKEAPYIMPSCHGDPSTPWNDLPAATWLSEMVPKSTTPMRPALCRPVQLQAGPAKEALVHVVKSAILDAECLFQREPLREKTNVDFNLLGEVHRANDSDNTVSAVETYWGWSRKFCQSMKDGRRRAHSAPSSSSRMSSRGRSRPRSKRPRYSSSSSRMSSRDRSRPLSKRPRYSSRSRSRRDSKSPRRGRSRSSDDFRHRHSERGRRTDSSYSRSRSPAPRRGRSDRRRSYSRSPSRSRTHSRSRSRSRPDQRRQYSPVGRRTDIDQPAPPLPPPNAPHAFLPMPSVPGHFPVPPPPPPMGYQGVFPPPPPPPPQAWATNQPQPGFAPPHMMGGWGQGPIPPSPPQPPMPYEQQQHQQRNGHWGRDSGRGGGGRGHRGRGRDRGSRGGYGYGY
ncbi:hypothetical protein HIM_00274 [Hirsutella minnesotensis 3608]|nr:hypothetical protein HIM_00274 [Hirsutella minnesotensis 3608]